MTNQQEVLGIFITKQEIGNMKIDHIHVSDFALQAILKSVHLTKEAQEEIVDKLVDRTPNWVKLDTNTQVNKIKTVLTQETIIEYLRLNDYIREGVDMVEVGIDEEGSVVASVFYVEKTEVLEKVFTDEMTEEQVNQLEKEINILDGSINIYEEAKKKMEQMDKNKVVPFMNRAARRKAAKNK
ncbi:hypothetical protein [Cytobacillus oceanisediminis]|uniref:hypothetical protein n=1 Tax=Cytobacillus oceanisediminis TaxID=665099 RepID=UPI001FB31B5E|nr:hypothetical protein [Cytobacillus oceanisediminis]UOE58210.1 hypothetical protein IRB79_27295 [Cytobacillus oceanisediminis]